MAGIVACGASVGKYKFTAAEWIKVIQATKLQVLSAIDNKDEDCLNVSKQDIENRVEWLIKVVYGTQIKARHFVVDLGSIHAKYSGKPPRVVFEKIFFDNIDNLMYEAAIDCIQSWQSNFPNKNISDITHVITHCASGFKVPSIAHELFHLLGLLSSCRAIHLSSLGCQGGQSTFYLAKQILASEKDAIILTVNADIFSCFQNLFYMINCEMNKETAISSGVMSDGGCAFLFENVAKFDYLKNELPAIYRLETIESYILPQSIWNQSNISAHKAVAKYYATGYIGRELVSKLRMVFDKYFFNWFVNDCGQNGDLNDTLMAMHGGGKLIFKQFCEMINEQSETKVDCARLIGYSKYRYLESGNLGCASHLYALYDIIKDYKIGHHCKNIYILAFGAGVEFHHGYLKLYEYDSHDDSDDNTKYSDTIRRLLIGAVLLAVIAAIFALVG